MSASENGSYRQRWVTHHQLEASQSQLEHKIDRKFFTLTLTLTILMGMMFFVVTIFGGLLWSQLDRLDKKLDMTAVEIKNETMEYINESNIRIMHQLGVIHWKGIQQKFDEQDQKILELQQERAQRAKRMNKSAEQLVYYIFPYVFIFCAFYTNRITMNNCID